MTRRVVVSDASSLIALQQVRRLTLLRDLFGSIVVPAAVAREVRPTLPALPSWIIVDADETPIDPTREHVMLGAGEIAAIALCRARGGDWLILDDLPARRLAERLGLPVIGTLGLLLAAKRRGLIHSVHPILDALISNGFRASARLVKHVLTEAGELS